MSTPEDDLELAREARDTARGALDRRIADLRGALDGKSVTDRLKADAASRARGLADDTLDIAVESRWIIAGTLVALIGWFLRGPIMRTARRALDAARSGEPRALWQRLRDWTVRKARS